MIGKTEFSIKATLDADGAVRAKAIGRCAYGSKSAAVDAEITDEKALAAIGAALTKALGADLCADLDQQATSAACSSLVVATNKGEKV